MTPEQQLTLLLQDTANRVKEIMGKECNIDLWVHKVPDAIINDIEQPEDEQGYIVRDSGDNTLRLFGESFLPF